jgi:hypothetical protein
MAVTSPESPEALLTRNQTAEALTQSGYPISFATLATKATRGGGPPYRKFGPRALYRWGDALQWAQERLSRPVRSTSEADAALAVETWSRKGKRKRRQTPPAPIEQAQSS